MSNPRYIPRSFARDSLDFGRVEELRWLREEDLDDTELDQLAASQFQHQIALLMNSAVSSRFISRESFSESAGLNPARLGRMLRGEVPMRLDDMALAQRRLGLKLFSFLDPVRD